MNIFFNIGTAMMHAGYALTGHINLDKMPQKEICDLLRDGHKDGFQTWNRARRRQYMCGGMHEIHMVEWLRGHNYNYSMWLPEFWDQGGKNNVIDLSGVDLSGANLRGANLKFVTFKGANLAGADLSGAKLLCADLSEANLDKAYLTAADVTHADLSHASLVGADLRAIEACRASFTEANLEKASLAHARLEKTSFGRANVDGTYFLNSGVTSSQLEYAENIRAARGLPQGFRLPSRPTPHELDEDDPMLRGPGWGVYDPHAFAYG
ncbi:MAG: pentapeptide repeat-containing protein [Alphaproteobacteria bacterium]